jgi:hypothetical protein
VCALTALALAMPALAGPLASAGSAASSQESWFQDDDQLIFNTPAGADRAMGRLAGLGVDRVRVSVFWATIAPESDSRTRPAFDASDPAAYPAGAWDRYDQIVQLARRYGMGVEFNFTSPAPLWATGRSPRADIAHLWQPSPSELTQFVRAVGRRYSGAYTPPSAGVPAPPAGTTPPPPPPPPCPPVDQIINRCPPTTAQAIVAALRPLAAAAADAPLPRVDHWSIWNEPDQPGWLDPQWTLAAGHRWVESSPRMYRGLLDGAYAALTATGHASDSILIGETAPSGVDVPGSTRAIKALHFLRQLYCLDDRYRPLRGLAASERGCPRSRAAGRRFAAAHPALFAASGYAHHPYQLTLPPGRAPADRDFATISTLPRLDRALDRVLAAYGRRRRGGMPVYLSEFGYNTRPPNPAGVTPSQQAAFIDQAQYIAYADPRVRALSQFLLVDDAPRPGRNGVRTGYGATFQTGLEFLGGRPKPALTAYELPLFLPAPVVRRGAALRVWGQVRPVAGGSARVAIQFRRGARSAFRTLVVVAADRGRGYLDARVHVPGSGRVRLAWTAAPGQVAFSRVASVSVR